MAVDSLQQINLLPEQYIPKQVPLSTQQIIQYMVFLTFFFTLVLATQVWMLERAKKEEKKTTLVLETIEKHLQDFKQNNPKPKLDTKLEQELIMMRETLNTKKQMLSRVSGLTLEDKPGFYRYLSGLAMQKIDGLWLTKIHIKDDGNYINIHGNTLNPEGLPSYLKRLNKARAFSGKIFDTVELNRASTSTPEIGFTLQLGQEEVPKLGEGEQE